MNKTKFIIVSVIIFMFAVDSYSQTYNYYFINNDRFQIIKNDLGNGWVEFKEELELNHSTIFQTHSNAFGLTSFDEMVLVRTSYDINLPDMMHYHFQQYHKGIKVESGQYVIHEKNGIAIRGNGKIIQNIDISEIPAITSEYAIQVSIDTLSNSGKSTNIDSSTYEIVYKNINPELLIKENYNLAYKNKLFADQTITIYVDAQNAEILQVSDNFNYCTEGTVETLYNGERNFLTKKQWSLFGDKYALDERCGGIITKRHKSLTFLLGFNQTSSNEWTDNLVRPTASAHWAAQMAYKYFLDVHNRWSVDHAGKHITIEFGVESSHTFMARCAEIKDKWVIQIQRPVYTNQTGVFNWPVALDVIGHEFTHGVVKYTTAGGLTCGDLCEGSALEESFCDIFGKMIEWWAAPESFSWDYMHQFIYSTEPDSHRRSFENPHNYLDAASYGDNNWNNVSDPGNVRYIRAGVQNHWFYLLADGGTYNGITVNGIGKENAAKIAYRMLDKYLTSGSNFLDSRNASIFSARDLFGWCSEEVIQTINAWNAVNVTDPGGMDYNLDVNCAHLAIFHEGFSLPPFIDIPPQPVHYIAINELTADCNISPDGHLVHFTAGNTVRLKNGFRSGSNFRASLEPCIMPGTTQMLASNNSSSPNQANANFNISASDSEIEKFEKDENQASETKQLDYAYEFSAFPNPFDNSTTINFIHNKTSRVKIYLTNSHGQEVLQLHNKYTAPGNYEIKIDGNRLKPGVYFCVIEMDRGRETIKIVKM